MFGLCRSSWGIRGPGPPNFAHCSCCLDPSACWWDIASLLLMTGSWCLTYCSVADQVHMLGNTVSRPLGSTPPAMSGKPAGKMLILVLSVPVESIANIMSILLSVFVTGESWPSYRFFFSGTCFYRILPVDIPIFFVHCCCLVQSLCHARFSRLKYSNALYRLLLP